MRITYLFTILTLSLVSCHTSDAKKTGNSSSEISGNTSDTKQNKSAASNSNGFWEKLVMNEISDGKGGVAAIVPMPAGWKFVKGGITGPHGVKVTDFWQIIGFLFVHL